MEFIRTYREKQQMRKQEEILRQAENVITLSDLDGSLYIAYNNVPFVPVEENWTSKEIMTELSKLRKNYINAKEYERKWLLRSRN